MRSQLLWNILGVHITVNWDFANFENNKDNFKVVKNVFPIEMNAFKGASQLKIYLCEPERGKWNCSVEVIM